MSVASPSRGTSASGQLKVNDAVHVGRESSHQQLEGVVAFIGEVSFAAGDDWVGVRLTGTSVGLGKNDGSVQGVRYFECGPNGGVFVRRSHVRRRTLTRLEELRFKRELAIKSPATSNSSSRFAAGAPPSSPARSAMKNGSTSVSATPPSTAAKSTDVFNDQSDRWASEMIDRVLGTTSETPEADTSSDQSDVLAPLSAPEQSALKKVTIQKDNKVVVEKAQEKSSRKENASVEPLVPNTQDDSLTSPLLAQHDNFFSSGPSPALEPLHTSQTKASSSLRRRPPRAENDNTEETATSRSRRILDRDAPFHQSRGKWSVQRFPQGPMWRQSAAATLRRRKCWSCWDDWFHSLAYRPTVVLMLILFLMYTSAVFFYAFIYRAMDVLFAHRTTMNDGSIKEESFCGMDITNKMEALYFSLSTMTTIGYGVSDYYFGDCWTPLLLVLCQVCTAITFDALAIGLLFQRMSRGKKRGKTIVFSDKAVVRRVRGCPYLMFRIGELRHHHIIEATVRVYCLRHERYPSAAQEQNGIETIHFMTRHLSLCHPDECTGSHILMGLPQVIVHKMDETSPLIPSRPVWYDANGDRHYISSALVPEVQAPVYQTPTEERLMPIGSSYSSDSGGVVDRYATQKGEIQEFLKDRDIEVIVIVEGTDEVTGSALQARHSYCGNEIVWDHAFLPCVFPWHGPEEEQDDEYSWMQPRGCRPYRKGQPACAIDFDRFHDITKAPIDCDECPFVPNRS